MIRFFSANEATNDKLQVFSPLHFGILALICLIIFGVFIFRRAMRQKNDQWRYIIAGLLLLSECSFQAWLVSTGKWNVKTTLPIELCEITSILAIVMLITKSYFLFETVYFWGWIGSVLALIFPDLPVDYTHFRFWVFMMTHALNLVALVFMMVVIGYKPTLKSLGASFLMLNMYMACMGALNHFTGSNYYFYYVFREPAPGSPGLLSNVQSGFFKMLILEALIFLSFFICYLPVTAINGFKKIFPRGAASR